MGRLLLRYLYGTDYGIFLRGGGPRGRGRGDMQWIKPLCLLHLEADTRPLGYLPNGNKSIVLDMLFKS